MKNENDATQVWHVLTEATDIYQRMCGYDDKAIDAFIEKILQRRIKSC